MSSGTQFASVLVRVFLKLYLSTPGAESVWGASWQMEALEQLGGEPPTAQLLAALQGRLCGLAATADLLRQRGLSHLLDPAAGQQQQQQQPQTSAGGPPAWLAPWLGLAVEAGSCQERCRSEAAPELAALAAGCSSSLLELQVRATLA